MDCARLNCSHGEREDLLRRTAAVREAAVRAPRAIAVLFDLQGRSCASPAPPRRARSEPGETLTFVGIR